MADVKQTPPNTPQRTAPAKPLDAGLGLISRLSPRMAAVVSALAAPGPALPTELADNTSAFAAISAQSPRLAQAIAAYVQGSVHHGESFDKVIEDACRALFGLPPMTDTEEVAWTARRQPGWRAPTPAEEHVIATDQAHRDADLAAQTEARRQADIENRNRGALGPAAFVGQPGRPNILGVRDPVLDGQH